MDTVVYLFLIVWIASEIGMLIGVVPVPAQLELTDRAGVLVLLAAVSAIIATVFGLGITGTVLWRALHKLLKRWFG